MAATYFDRLFAHADVLADDDAGDAEATMHRCFANERGQQVDQEVCMVQIYPADVVGGMMLLEQPTFVIGRDPACDLVLTDQSVSRRHVSIRLGRDGYYADDLESTNGTLVNGKPITRCRLESGDTIQIGSFIFKFLFAGSVESQYHETVYTAMTRDGLTGTMNKRYLLESMQREIARCARQKQPLSVVMIDIDHFKTVNDSHGHLVGDEVLREFGRRLLSVCREESILARYGGEEFSLLLTSTELAEAIDVCQRCRCEIADTTFATSAGPLGITASFGIGCLPIGESVPVTDLIKIADDRLYRAKQQGRNRVAT